MTTSLVVDTKDPNFLTYSKECPLCYCKFNHTRPKDGAIRSRGKESDFHIRYADVNPDYYVVAVCTNCWYASFLSDFADLTRMQRDNLAKMPNLRRELEAQGFHYEYGGQRTPEMVDYAYRLALKWYERRKVGPARLAEVWLHITWLYREQGDQERERESMEQAQRMLTQAYEQSELEEEAEKRVAYLIFDLSLRLGKWEDANMWSGMLLGDQYLADHKGLRTMFMDRYNDFREMKRA
jgi:uncharacterized protein